MPQHYNDDNPKPVKTSKKAGIAGAVMGAAAGALLFRNPIGIAAGAGIGFTIGDMVERGVRGSSAFRSIQQRQKDLDKITKDL